MLFMETAPQDTKTLQIPFPEGYRLFCKVLTDILKTFSLVLCSQLRKEKHVSLIFIFL